MRIVGDFLSRCLIFFLDIAVDREIDSIVIPSNSTLYTKEVDRNPIDICDITQAQGTDVGNTGGE